MVARLDRIPALFHGRAGDLQNLRNLPGIQPGLIRANSIGMDQLKVEAIETDPQIVTIRSKAMTPLAPDTSRQGDIIKIDTRTGEYVERVSN